MNCDDEKVCLFSDNNKQKRFSSSVITKKRRKSRSEQRKKEYELFRKKNVNCLQRWKPYQTHPKKGNENENWRKRRGGGRNYDYY